MQLLEQRLHSAPRRCFLNGLHAAVEEAQRKWRSAGARVLAVMAPSQSTTRPSDLHSSAKWWDRCSSFRTGLKLHSQSCCCQTVTSPCPVLCDSAPDLCRLMLMRGCSRAGGVEVGQHIPPILPFSWLGPGCPGRVSDGPLFPGSARQEVRSSGCGCR